jgi:hypothetical protein
MFALVVEVEVDNRGETREERFRGLRDEHVYADRGEAMPKGFEDTVRLYEVRWRE